MKMLIARENTGHASNLFVDTQYSFAHFNLSTHLNRLFYPYTSNSTASSQNFARTTLLIGNDR